MEDSHCTHWKSCKTLGIKYVDMHWLNASMVVSTTAQNCLAAAWLGTFGDGLSPLVDKVAPLVVKVEAASELAPWMDGGVSSELAH